MTVLGQTLIGQMLYSDKDGETPLMMAAEFSAYETFLGTVLFIKQFESGPASESRLRSTTFHSGLN